MGTLVMIGQVLLSLSILVVLHEWGHFYAARSFNTKVEKFYLFFNPGFSLFKKQIGETEYGIGWLPLGGYVKIAGMIDESFDKEQMEGPAQPWEFRSKPAYQRLLIMLGGVIVNFILGFFIYAMMLWGYGDKFFPAENITNGISVVDPVIEDMGFQNGDKILKVGDRVFDKFEPNILTSEIVLNNADKIQIERNGQTMTLSVHDTISNALSSYGKGLLFVPRTKSVVKEITKDSNAEKAGLQAGDVISSVNGSSTVFFDQYNKLMEGLKGQTVNMSIMRNGQAQSLAVETDQDGKIGFYMELFQDQYKSEKISYSLLQAIPAGIKKGVKFLATQMKAFGQMGKGKISAKDSVGGPIAIASMFGSVWDWEHFWGLTAALSLILAFMNLLPIPALDGGHVMFLLWEMITGKKPSDKFLEYATLTGFIILMALMVLIFGNDIRRIISGIICWF